MNRTSFRSKTLNIPSVIQKVITMADGSLRLYVDTAELTPEITTELFNLFHKSGVFAFSESKINDVVSADVSQPQPKGVKSPSQRLRSVIYLYWKMLDREIYPDFGIYYNGEIETLISKYKELLP